jgi:hypothetical protein
MIKSMFYFVHDVSYEIFLYDYVFSGHCEVVCLFLIKFAR